MQVDKPGVYPLETRECPEPAHWRTAPSYCVCQATDDRVCWMVKYGESGDGANPRCSCACHSCDRCHGTGRVPDENGAKVEIELFLGPLSEREDDGYYYHLLNADKVLVDGFFEAPSDGPFPTPAAAFAAAQRAHFAPGGPHDKGVCGPVCTFGDW